MSRRERLGGATLVLVTCPDRESADRIASSLTTKRLAACVSVAEGVRSLYRWKGKIEEAGELLLMIKTRRRILDRVVYEVKLNHPYQTPEILALPIIGGSQEYLRWLIEETSHPTDPCRSGGVVDDSTSKRGCRYDR
ncbi:divalent-cation tolerance protein CutA [Candidatus Bathyarchaeota archaeon]|nr:divalent-cation tolerance protein CutA [Candidatus Bathyarchaeota archaeon]